MSNALRRPPLDRRQVATTPRDPTDRAPRRRLGVARWWAAAAGLALLSTASCTHTWRNPFAPSGPPAPEVLVAGMSIDQVISAVNLNAARIQSYRTTNASITIPGVPGIPRLSGNIALERPRRLRLTANSLLGPEVDLGSNNDLFWLWVSRNEPPALYFARHDQYAGSEAQRMLPIEPDWLMDALGLAMFEPGDVHDGPRLLGDGTLEIRSVLNRPTGQKTKRTIIDARRAWVLQQHIYDAQGALLASAILKDHRYHPEAQVSLPQRIEIEMPATQLRLAIDVGSVQLNVPATNPELWQLPAIAGFPRVDLGTASAAATSSAQPGPSSFSTTSSPPAASDLATRPSPATPPALAPRALAPRALAPEAAQASYRRETSAWQRLPAGGIATSQP